MPDRGSFRARFLPPIEKTGLSLLAGLSLNIVSPAFRVRVKQIPALVAPQAPHGVWECRRGVTEL